MDNATAITPGVAAFLGTMGLLMLASGYRLMRVASKVNCAVLLAAAGAALGQSLAPPWGAIALLIVGAVVGFLVGNAYYFLNIGLTGAAAGFMMGVLGCLLTKSELSVLPLAGGAVVGAGLAVLFERPIGIFGTSLVGAMIVALAAQRLITGAPMQGLQDLRPAWLALAGVLALAGCFFQTATGKNLPRSGRKGSGDGRHPVVPR